MALTMLINFGGIPVQAQPYVGFRYEANQLCARGYSKMFAYGTASQLLFRRPISEGAKTRTFK